MRLYEKEALFLAEGAQILSDGADYAQPAHKRNTQVLGGPFGPLPPPHIAPRLAAACAAGGAPAAAQRLLADLVELDRRELETKQAAAAAVVAFRGACAAWGVPGTDIRSELRTLPARLPDVWAAALAAVRAPKVRSARACPPVRLSACPFVRSSAVRLLCPDAPAPQVGEALEYYEAFTGYAHPQREKGPLLPLLSRLRADGADPADWTDLGALADGRSAAPAPQPAGAGGAAAGGGGGRRGALDSVGRGSLGCGGGAGRGGANSQPGHRQERRTQRTRTVGPVGPAPRLCGTSTWPTLRRRRRRRPALCPRTITPGESAAAGPTEIDWDTDVSAAAESAGLPAEGADQGPAAASADSAPAQGAPCAAAAPGGAATLLGGATFREALMSELRELRAFVAQGARPLLQSS